MDLDVFERGFLYRSIRGYELKKENPFGTFEVPPEEKALIPASLRTHDHSKHGHGSRKDKSRASSSVEHKSRKEQASPKPNQDTPKKEQASPKPKKDTSTKEQASPKPNQETSTVAQSSPNPNQDTSTKEKASPNPNQDTLTVEQVIQIANETSVKKSGHEMIRQAQDHGNHKDSTHVSFVDNSDTNNDQLFANSNEDSDIFK